MGQGWAICVQLPGREGNNCSRSLLLGSVSVVAERWPSWGLCALQDLELCRTWFWTSGLGGGNTKEVLWGGAGAGVGHLLRCQVEEMPGAGGSGTHGMPPGFAAWV